MSRLLWRIFNSLLSPLSPADPEAKQERSLAPVVDASEEEEEEVFEKDWTVAAENLRLSLGRLTKPDPAAAREIVALAQELFEACEDEARRQRLFLRRGALRERLTLLEQAFAGDLEKVAEEGLSDLETLVAAYEIEKERSEAASAETARVKRLLDAANDQDDFDEIERLSGLRRASVLEQARIEEARERSRAALLAGLGDLSGEPAEAPAPQAEEIAPEAARPKIAPPLVQESEAERDDESAPEAEASFAFSAPSGPGEPEAAREEAVSEEAAAPAVFEDAAAEEAAPVSSAAFENMAEAQTEVLPDVALNVVALSPPAEAEEAAPSNLAASAPECDAPTPLSTPEALALHLSRGETALAWHLTRLIDSTKETPPVPLAALEALVLAPTVQDAEYAADLYEQSIVLAEALDALPFAQAPEATTTLLLAALLRPAFFTPDFGARRHLANLPRLGDAALCQDLVETLSDLEHRFRLSTEDLAELAGRERARRSPAAKRALSSWLSSTLQRQHKHKPSGQILHGALAPHGELGGAIEAALAGRADAEALAQAVVARLSTREGREDFVFACEQRSGRPSKDRIVGNALIWLTSRLEEAGAELEAWIDASRFDRSALQSDKAQLGGGLKAVRRAAEDARAALLAAPDLEDPLARAARARLLASVEDLLALIAGGGVWRTPQSRAALFEEPLLRLPGGCQDWTGGAAELEEERRVRDERLWKALRRRTPLPPDDLSAFKIHQKAMAILPARALLARMRAADSDQEEALDLLERKLEDEGLGGARKAAKERTARLRQDLTTLANLDVGILRDQESGLERLAVISAALSRSGEEGEVSIPALNGLREAAAPPDFPELNELLLSFEADRDLLRARIREAQSGDLEALRADPRKAASAEALLAAIDRLDPVHLDASIAELRAGREVFPPQADRPDGFSRFFPEFVEQVALHPPALPAVSSAIQNGERVGPLDFSRLSPAARRRAGRLHEGWAKAAKSFRAKEPRPLGETLKDFFQDLGASSVKIESERDEVPSRLRVFQLTCAPWRSDDRFIPPAYGSAANGLYALAVVSGEGAFEDVLGRLSRIGRSRPTIALFFGRLDARQRRHLARLLRRDRSQTLLLDETLLYHILMEEGEALASFLAAAAPFSWLQPYEVNPGRTAPEMFVGREEEMRLILSRESRGSLVYGGRRLGKSALLDRIRLEHHRPDEGKMAFTLEIAHIGGAGSPASDLWTAFANRLRQERAFSRIGGGPDEILGAVSNWLAESPERRLIAMFDEADRFLRAEHAADYPNLTLLKQAMQDSGWRFKAVFAGLHNLRRMAQAPNSPLPHLGEAICVGPMGQTSDGRAALRRLVVEPMRAAGFECERPELIDAILARANYYPSLTQVFCGQVIESLGRRLDDASSGPRWSLDQNALFEGEAATLIDKEIRARFQLTLNLDSRFDLIAKSLAKHRLEAPEEDRAVIDGGLTIKEIWGMIAEWWPSSRPAPSREDLADLLLEMADLGVLTNHGAGRFSLLNARIAQMLGDLKRLDDDIIHLSLRNEALDYDAALFHRSLAPELPGERSPLPDRRLEELFDHEAPGLRIVEGRSAVTGEGLGRRLLAAAMQWRTYLKIKLFERQQDARPPGRDVSAWVNGLGLARGLLIVDRPWDQRVANYLQKRPEVVEGRLLPIWALQDSEGPAQDAATQDAEGAAASFHAGVWSELMLRHWLLEEGLFVYDDLDLRRALVSATGLAPRRIFELKSILTSNLAQSSAQQRDALEAWPADRALTAEEVGFGAAFAAPLNLLLRADDRNPAAAAEIDALCAGAARAFELRDLAVSDGKGGLRPTALGRLVGKNA